MAFVPPSVRTEIAAALGISEDGLQARQPTSGGCISQGVRLDAGLDCFFLKWKLDAPATFFHCEAQGLGALARGPLPVPNVVAQGHTWLLLEWIESASPTASSWEGLGRSLAKLHRSQRVATFGWDHANFIGSLPQPNDNHDSWSAFWCDVRLRLLMLEAETRGLLAPTEIATLNRAIDAVPDLIDDVGTEERPSLLHGDLWSGNVMFSKARGGNPGAEPVIIDPAVYAGHREVDLAMTRLFGGFPQAFHDAYEEEWPLTEGHEHRTAVYQLYPLLVHLLLFGRGYAAQLASAARRVNGE